MIYDAEIKRIFRRYCSAEPSEEEWPDIVKFGRAVAIAALDDAATLIELEYAPHRAAHERLKQIARHVRDMTAPNDSGCPSGKCTAHARDCFWYENNETKPLIGQSRYNAGLGVTRRKENHESRSTKA
jgi:hypothetical protein